MRNTIGVEASFSLKRKMCTMELFPLCCGAFHVWLAVHFNSAAETLQIFGQDPTQCPEEFLEEFNNFGSWILGGIGGSAIVLDLSTLENLHDALFSNHFGAAMLAQKAFLLFDIWPMSFAKTTSDWGICPVSCHPKAS